MKGLKKWSLLVLLVAGLSFGFVSCSDDDDDDDDTMTYYLLQQQQKEAEKKAQEEATAAPEGKVGVEYTDTESGNKVVMNEDGSKTVTTPQGQKTTVNIVKSFEKTQNDMYFTPNGFLHSGNDDVLIPGVWKEKYDFYSDGTCLVYDAMYMLCSDISKEDMAWKLS